MDEEEGNAYESTDLEPEVSLDRIICDFGRHHINDGDDISIDSASDCDVADEKINCKEPFLIGSAQKSSVQSDDHLVKAYHCIRAAFDLYKPHELAIADNGGKYSIVLNHFIDLYLSAHGGFRPPSFRPNIISKEEFYNSDVHIHFDHKLLMSNASLKGPPALDMVIINGLSFGHALTAYHGLQPNVRAVFTDRCQADVDVSNPDERVDAFQAPAYNWPPIMSINPIASWSYQQIWEYIDENELHYPDAYRQGYTSLGPGAQPNPLLRRDNGTYRHARELTDATRERDGRI